MPISDILVLGYFFGYYEKFFGYFWLFLGVSSATWLRHHLATLTLATALWEAGTRMQTPARWPSPLGLKPQVMAPLTTLKDD